VHLIQTAFDLKPCCEVKMDHQSQNDLVTILFLTILGGWLYMLLSRQQTQPKKSQYRMSFPAQSKSREYAHNQAILKYAPHSLGGSIISLN
jgi:hypothetical protein